MEEEKGNRLSDRIKNIREITSINPLIIKRQISHLESKKRFILSDLAILKDINTKHAQDQYIELKKTLELLDFWIKRV